MQVCRWAGGQVSYVIFLTPLFFKTPTQKRHSGADLHLSVRVAPASFNTVPMWMGPMGNSALCSPALVCYAIRTETPRVCVLSC